MSREIDIRYTGHGSGSVEALAFGVPVQHPGIKVFSFDTAASLQPAAFAPPGLKQKGNFVQRALNQVNQVVSTFSAGGQAPEFQADASPSETSSGAVTVHLKQRYKSIPIFQSAQTVRFAPEGSLNNTLGTLVSVTDDVDATPVIQVSDAVMRAARLIAVPQPDDPKTDQFGQPLPAVRVNLAKFTPTVLATFSNLSEQPTVFDKGPFASPITASLIWFPVGTELVLTWEVMLVLPKFSGQYRTLVNARTGDIVYSTQLMTALMAQANVYRLTGQNGREVVKMPMSWTDYKLDVTQVPNGNPRDWVDDSKTTAGYCVAAHLGENSATTPQPAPSSSVLTFNPNDPQGDDQKVVNLFYFNCFMHDFFYLLGFREQDGNFESTNTGRGDRVDARAYSGAVWGTANMLTPSDRSTPIMNMGLYTGTMRHTAFDSTVVFHEYMHGVTNRLVGGQRDDHSLEKPQSRGMGEGWGDYIACTINKTTVVGAWLLNNPGGNRAYPYDSNYPDGFDKLGTGRYSEIHNMGEIWCATLMEMNRQIGDSLGLQLVIDALKLAPSNPGFLDMRDSIISSLRNKLLAQQISQSVHNDKLNGIWKAFAKFGMGPAARSDGAELTGIVADFNPPASTSTNPTTPVVTTPPPTTTTTPITSPTTPPPVTTQPSSGGRFHGDGRPNAPIPDGDPNGVTHSIPVNQAGSITNISVSVTIQHSYPADLQIWLTPPGGPSIILYNRIWGAGGILNKTMSAADTPVLAGLKGKMATGVWALKVADVAAEETGTFQSWSLDIQT